jgi:hypothetical protein
MNRNFFVAAACTNDVRNLIDLLLAADSDDEDGVRRNGSAFANDAGEAEMADAEILFEGSDDNEQPSGVNGRVFFQEAAQGRKDRHPEKVCPCNVKP